MCQYDRCPAQGPALSHQNEGKVKMKVILQWSAIQSWVEFCFQWDSDTEPCDPKSGVLTTRPPRHFRKFILPANNNIFCRTYQWTDKALIRLNRCIGWPGSLLFTYMAQVTFSYAVHLHYITLYGQLQLTTNCWYFSYFSQKIGSDISCKLSQIARKVKAYFLG